jgi:DNA-binding transcriptional ArsR family regulator
MSTSPQPCIRVSANQEQLAACSEAIRRAGPTIKQLASVLSLAGNEVRLKILYLLDLETELCPCDLSDVLGMSVPAISQHLRKLKDGGIVGIRNAGQTIFYSLKPEHLEILHPLFKHISVPINPNAV